MIYLRKNTDYWVICIFFSLLLNFENNILYMMIPRYPPKVFKIISSISQNLYGIKPWINSTPKVIINTAKRVLVLFFSNLMYIKNPN